MKPLVINVEIPWPVNISRHLNKANRSSKEECIFVPDLKECIHIILEKSEQFTNENKK